MATHSSTGNSSELDTITIDRRHRDRRGGELGDGQSGETREPRRKQQRRRHIDPTTCERDYNEQEIEFMRAMDDYKRAAGRQFPTCSEVLEVIRSLGYVQLSDAQIEQLGLDTIDGAAAGFAVDDGDVVTADC